MTGSEGISVADALALRNGAGNDGLGGFGGNGAWWIIVLILFFAVGGWGRNNGNGNSDGASGGTPYMVGSYMNFGQLESAVRGISNGLCDGFYATNNAVRDVGMALQQCCCQTQQTIASLGTQLGQQLWGIEKTILQDGFNDQAGFNSLGSQLSSCCCDIERGQDAIKYELAQFANNLLVAGDKNTDRIINFLTQSELQNLRTQNEEYRSQLQFNTQTRTLIDTLLPMAKPAYITCSPYVSSYGMPQYGYGYGYPQSQCCGQF